MTTKHTAGPWCWFSNSNGPYLATPDRGHLLVMDFARKGMNGAQPRFAVWKGEDRERMGGLMRRAEELDLAQHPDSRLIAAAPDLLQSLEVAMRQWRAYHALQNDHDIEDERSTEADLYRECEAAIAKATVAEEPAEQPHL